MNVVAYTTDVRWNSTEVTSDSFEGAGTTGPILLGSHCYVRAQSTQVSEGIFGVLFCSCQWLRYSMLEVGEAANRADL